MPLQEHFLELLRKATADLPPDVETALRSAREAEEEGSRARNAMDSILENVAMAREASTPICQDTGTLIFYIDYPEHGSERVLRQAAQEAAAEATRRSWLRSNAVDIVSGKNSGNNIGVNHPYFHFQQWERPETRVRVMLKGGGCENVGAQYRLPDMALQAGRDLKGVRRCVLDAALKAQGYGCSPGILGVGIGGDRCVSYLLSKEQFFRRLGSRNPEPALAAMEEELERSLNTLGVGPLGFGGRTTVLGVLIGAQHRHPASYFVSISYMCWAFRRKTLVLQPGGEVTYED